MTLIVSPAELLSARCRARRGPRLGPDGATLRCCARGATGELVTLAICAPCSTLSCRSRWWGNRGQSAARPVSGRPDTNQSLQPLQPLFCQPVMYIDVEAIAEFAECEAARNLVASERFPGPAAPIARSRARSTTMKSAPSKREVAGDRSIVTSASSIWPTTRPRARAFRLFRSEERPDTRTGMLASKPCRNTSSATTPTSGVGQRGPRSTTIHRRQQWLAFANETRRPRSNTTAWLAVACR
jgi:hypothetical protein